MLKRRIPRFCCRLSENSIRSILNSSGIKLIKCIICGSKKNFIAHHKVNPLVRNTFDETITLCQRCHTNVHEGFADSHKYFEIEKTGYFIDLVNKPHKFLLRYRQKKKIEEIAFYWALYNYGTLASIYSWKALKQSVIRL